MEASASVAWKRWRNTCLLTAATLLPACGARNVVSASLGGSTPSVSLELRRDLESFADSFVVHSSYLTGDGTAEVYGITGNVDCTASNLLVVAGWEWRLNRTHRGGGDFGVSLALAVGSQQVTYDDGGSGEVDVNSGVEPVDICVGAFASVRLGGRSSLQATYQLGVPVDALMVASLDYRFAAAERVTVIAGWRWLRIVTPSGKRFPTGESGTQIMETESSGFVAGAVLTF